MTRRKAVWRSEWSTHQDVIGQFHDSCHERGQSASTPVRRCPIRCQLASQRLVRMGRLRVGWLSRKTAFFNTLTCGAEFTGESRLLYWTISVFLLCLETCNMVCKRGNRSVFSVCVAGWYDDVNRGHSICRLSLFSQSVGRNKISLL